MDWREFLNQYRHVLEASSRFEVLFVEEVLSRVPEMDFEKVEVGTQFIDSTGTTRYIDFTIQEGQLVRIAIEVDGWDKKGRGTGMTKREFEDFSRREADLTAQGWTVLRFANTLVMRDPQGCARNLSLVLRRERSRAVKEGGVAFPKGGSEDLDPAESRELKRLEEERERSIEQIEAQVESTRHEARRLRRLVWGGMAGVAFVGFVVMCDAAFGCFDNEWCAGGVSWQEVDDLVGQRGVVHGEVKDAAYVPNAEGGPTFLDMGAAFPDPERVSVVIWDDNRESFEMRPEEAYHGSTICVEGTVGRYNDRVTVEVEDPGEIIPRRWWMAFGV